MREIITRYGRPRAIRCDNGSELLAQALIARGLAGPSLLAHVLVSKYADHLPLYRQSAIYAREGVELDRSTLADWVGQSSALLRPLGEALARHVLAAGKVHADDTLVPVLAPGAGRTKTGRLWAYVRDDRPAADETPPAVLFRYSPDRKGQHPQAHLKEFRGILQADAYAGFNALYGKHIVEAACCWAHVRRKFYDLTQAGPAPLAEEVLQRIAALYAIEAEVRGQPPDRRRTVRQARAGPRLAALKAWLQATLSQVSTKSALAAAIQYALVHWTALVRYIDDGRIEIDNNAAERVIRAVALGRKNYLFAGSDAGGERAALIYAQAKARDVVKMLRTMKLRKAAELVEQHIDETLSYYAYPPQHWIKLRTNNPMERLLREVRRRTKVVGAFPDGHSALMLVAARLRHVYATSWGTRKYMNMKLLEQLENQAADSAA